jgi:hypothetical protein
VNGYVAAGYLVSLSTLAAYAGWIVRRGRRLARDKRRAEAGPTP